MPKPNTAKIRRYKYPDDLQQYTGVDTTQKSDTINSQLSTISIPDNEFCKSIVQKYKEMIKIKTEELRHLMSIRKLLHGKMNEELEAKMDGKIDNITENILEYNTFIDGCEDLLHASRARKGQQQKSRRKFQQASRLTQRKKGGFYGKPMRRERNYRIRGGVKKPIILP